MQLASNAQRAAGLTAVLVNLVHDGYAGSRPFVGLSGHSLADAFGHELSSATRERIAGVPDAGSRLASVARCLRPVFEATDDASAAQTLNQLIRAYGARPYLVEDVGQPFHLHFHGDAETAVESLAGELACSLAVLMDTFGRRRFGICQAAVCDRVYVDLTRNGSRLYCSETCAAREKMADYRRRRRTTDADE